MNEFCEYSEVIRGICTFAQFATKERAETGQHNWQGIISRVKFTTLFFDLDDTIYPASTGLWHAIKERMNIYMREKLGFAPEEIPALRDRLFQTYGTTLRGLENEYEVDTQDFLAFVHDLPLRDYLRPDPSLRRVLRGLPQRKLIFTNADAAHARRVMDVVGVSDCFDGIVDVNTVAPYCKPMPESFDIARSIAGEPASARCVLIDDIGRTTQAAMETGMFSILFGRGNADGHAHAGLTDWRDLPGLIRIRENLLNTCEG